MTPSHTTRRGRRYRYYLCSSAQKKGWATCPSKSIPARRSRRSSWTASGALDAIPTCSAMSWPSHGRRTRPAPRSWRPSGGAWSATSTGWHGEVRKLSIQLRPGEDNGELVGRLADLHERIGAVEAAVGKVREHIKGITDQLIPEEQAAEGPFGVRPGVGVADARTSRRG